MLDNKTYEAIELIESFLFGEGEECGEKLYIDFAKKYKNDFMNSKLTESTENKFEFTDLHKIFQNLYEEKLEEIINKCGMTADEFYEEIRKRCEEGDQEIILFVDILNQIVDYNSFIEMIANIVNKV